MKSAVRLILPLAALIFVLLPARAEAESYSFSSCLDNSSSLCDSLASQLKFEVTEGSGYVDFTFTNTGGSTSDSGGWNITDLYFSASGLLAGITIEAASSDVNFTGSYTEGSSTFALSNGTLGNADAVAVSNGLDADGEYLSIRFDIAEGKTFADIIEALNMDPGNDQGIRIAAHLQQTDSDSLIQSIAFVTATPEPASIALFGLVALGVAYRLRRRLPSPPAS
jgi:hypothetical protein